MPMPFGVGVGDFIAVGSLIAKIAVELRKNGEAAPAYQYLLLELEALDRALQQLQDLRPSQHELLQLNSIRATALSCARPLQEFLDKIIKFESRLGTFALKNNRSKGFPRRMQWRMMYKDDVVELRTILGSHVATINLLLMTQTVRSITLAENDRAEVASELKLKIMAHRGLLEEAKDKMDFSAKQHAETNMQLKYQAASLQNLEMKTDSLDERMQDQGNTLEELHSLALAAEQKTTSIFSTTTDILTLITSGLSTLQAIVTHLMRTFELLTKFTIEMRVVMGELLQRFWSLQAAVSRIERALPMQVHLPTIQFTDAFGESMALPYQLCQKWSTFKELLRVMYINRQGWFRVDLGQYLIINVRGGRLIKRNIWEDMVKEGDHLSMCIALDIRATEGHCPFPSCQASLDGTESKNGGKSCPECGRWALSIPRSSTSIQGRNRSPLLDYEYTEPEAARVDLKNELSTENVEIYRQIYVQTVPDDSGDLQIMPGPTSQADNPIESKGVLEPPEERPPEDSFLVREGVDSTNEKYIPPGARWTKISRKLVNPEALEVGKERYEARDDFVIVLRVLSGQEEIQDYATLQEKNLKNLKPLTLALLVKYTSGPDAYEAATVIEQCPDQEPSKEYN
ncbi:hypothetical protein EG329_013586 [Mollisiaceae sp. DMI_Dod_QoI]|nr:hypothetical protein EG329_013586 [Helotiales sp. DMI_Dod_QoI]